MQLTGLSLEALLSQYAVRGIRCQRTGCLSVAVRAKTRLDWVTLLDNMVYIRMQVVQALA
jgi:hypothetical protein